MRVFWNLFRTDMKRAIFSGTFLVTVIGMLLVEMLSVGQMLPILDYSVVEMLDQLFAGTGSCDMLLMLFPLLPFALSYAREEEERAVTFWMVRTHTQIYMTSRYLVACISAFLCVVVSLGMATLFFHAMGHELYRGMWYTAEGYGQFLYDGQPFAYLTVFLTDRGFSAAMMAGCAVWISSICPNQYLTFVGPICLYYLVLRILPFSDPEKPYLLVSSWVEGEYNAPEGGVVSLLCKLGVTLLICAVYYLLSVHFVNRRWHYA